MATETLFSIIPNLMRKYNEKTAFVCQRNTKLPFIFEAAKATNIELIMTYNTAESAPTQHPTAVTSTRQLPVFDKPKAALNTFAIRVKIRNIARFMTLREEASYEQLWLQKKSTLQVLNQK